MTARRLWAATRKGLFLVEEGAGGFRIAATRFLGDHATMVLADRRDGAVYAALEHGHFGAKLHRSDDRGGTFREIAAPKYPTQPEGEVEAKNWTTGQPIQWKLRKVWSLETAGDDRPGALWAGTIPGGLFLSKDRGASWEIVEPLWRHPDRKRWFGGGEPEPGIHSIVVDPRNSRRVFVAVSCGGVWLTEDGGETWTCRADGMRAEYMPPEQQRDPVIQDPHRMVACAAAPDVLWCQHHNGVFRSTDGAKSWQEITQVNPSVFGFAVGVHPRDPDLAWLVPAIKDEKRIPVDGKVVVARTRDGAKTFDILRNGLPQEHAYDLVFRHGLDVHPDGDAVAVGSTTGSLWITGDRGETWQTVSEHLPPVYCVRWE
ncbi:MAG: hypothetical protein HMLKMBBP_02478 [Planctomycetes bacterium]|nr:hypothetical protein [Planctomycetota bacterium]